MHLCSCRLELRKPTSAEVETIQMIQRAPTSESCGHSKTVLGQRPLARLRLQHCSTTTPHGAPARRHAACREALTTCHHRGTFANTDGNASHAVLSLDSCSCSARRPASCAHDRQCCSIAAAPAATSLPGSAAPAGPRAPTVADPCSIEPLMRENYLRGSLL